MGGIRDRLKGQWCNSNAGTPHAHCTLGFSRDISFSVHEHHATMTLSEAAGHVSWHFSVEDENGCNVGALPH